MVEDNTQTYASSSPVATHSSSKKWQSRLFLAGASVVILGGFFMQHLSKAKNPPQKEEVSAPAVNVTAPQLSPVQQQMNQIESALSDTSRSMNDDNPDQEAEKLERMRMVAPTTVYSSSGASSQIAKDANEGKLNNGVLGNGAGDINTQFMSQVSGDSVPTATAIRMAHPSTTLAQGTVIWATLESRIVSDLPGMIRAITSEDIYSEDGSQVLLPRGSRLLGQYTNAIAQGQQRVFVVWQRIIRPDHINIQLNSPGTDPLGAAGVGADAINRHFFEQFGNSFLLSIIGMQVANNGVSTQDQFNSASAYREQLANSFSQTAQNTLQMKGVINPTLYIDQGKPISVFVARDLDFNEALTGR